MNPGSSPDLGRGPRPGRDCGAGAGTGGRPRVAVVGGGIAGLAAALRLRDRLGSDAEIIVFEQGGEVGGKLRTGTAGGVMSERGADAFLIRSPGGTDSAAVELVRRVGLADEMVHPEPIPPGLWLHGAVHRFPAGTLLGIPDDPETVAPVANVDQSRDRDRGVPLLGKGEDTTVGGLVRRRYGDEVVDRLVDPMLGGVYAGRADGLSLAATIPGLASAARTETTLQGAVRAARRAAPRPSGAPVFASIRGGLGRLVAATASVSGAQIRLGLPVRQITFVADTWRLVVGSTRDPETIDVDAVVLALPARPAARLLRGLGKDLLDPAIADQVGELDYASVGLVTLVLPATVELPEWSGFLVPADQGTIIKAVTFVTQKWPHVRGPGDPVLVRASVGRYQESEPLRLADAMLADQVHTELSELLAGHVGSAQAASGHHVGEYVAHKPVAVSASVSGPRSESGSRPEPWSGSGSKLRSGPGMASLPAPLAVHVHRWGGALPQYRPGHLDQVAAARAALPATLQLAGAGYDGVGIAACAQSGWRAADQVADELSA